MRFSLPATIVLFCATTALAFPQPSNNDIIARDDDGLDLSNVDITDVDINEVDFNADDFGSLETRATLHCANIAKIKRVKKEYGGKCHPNNSKGFRSAHNCKDKEGGKSYLCVQSNKATCYTISAAIKKNFESGECFIRK